MKGTVARDLETMNQIINMVMRILMRKAINSGINAGLGAASNKMGKRKRANQVPMTDDFDAEEQAALDEASQRIRDRRTARQADQD